MASVLVIDDDPDIRDLLRHKLDQAGLEVRTEGSGTAGLRATKEMHPDIVLIDWMMQDISGLEICRAVRADHALDDVRLVVVSGRADEADIEWAYAAGADEYVVKPFSPNDMVRTVEGLLAAERGEQSGAGDGATLPTSG